MDKLNIYLKHNGYMNNIKWKDLGYKRYTEFRNDLIYLCERFNIKILEEREKRLSQTQFRNELIKKYNSCIITNYNSVECEAAHIIPVKDNGEYIVSNGLLLNSCIHKTFDLYYWSINPDTLKIEVNSNYYTSINNYEGKIIDLDNNVYEKLVEHYKIFKKLI